MPELITAVALAACWGTVVAVWCVGAVFNRMHRSGERVRDHSGDGAQIGAAVLCGALVLASRPWWRTVQIEVAWVQVLGLVVLIVATAFALWARLSLGTAWSIAPEVSGDRRLRTSGPYGVTRHPIYTGLFGMILGTALLTGSGQVIAFVPVALVLVGLKIHFEERLLSSTYPDEYSAYRRRVPQLVPGLAALRARD